MFIKLKSKKLHKYILITLLTIFAILAILIIAVEAVNARYSDRFFPGIAVNNINIGRLTKAQASEILATNLSPHADKITLSSSIDSSSNYEIPLSSINFSFDVPSTINEAFLVGRTTSRIQNVLNIISSLAQKTAVEAKIIYSNPDLDKAISIIAAQATIEPVYPSASLVSKEVVVQSGKPGTSIDNMQVKQQILTQLSNNDFNKITVVVTPVNPTLNDQKLQDYKDLVSKFLGKDLLINYEYTQIKLTDSDIVTLIKPNQTYNKDLILQKVSNIASQIDRAPQNSVFVFENNKVKEFTPSKDGVKVKQDELVNLIISSLDKLGNSDQKELAFDAPVLTSKPQITNSEVNDLGINELIGRGTSKFAHSIPSRVHNVALAASKVSGALVKPGETFSFNQALGDVSAYTGFQQAYVIKDGKTVLGDGGGVCQVSTTLFRAALNAGLPITERQGHSYRVGYYEQDSPPGIDATVYGPHPDLRFTNDTSANILIQAQTDTKNLTLVFELYGTSDGRVAEITKPVMSNVSAPPEDLYQDDSTLPTGVVKQVEYKAWGGTATFSYTVKDKDGNVAYTKKFVTNYQPWQAVYLRGTGPTQ